MKHFKRISFLLPMLCLMVLLAGCQERGSGTDDVVNNESKISQETQQNVSDIDTADTEEVSLVNETETICEKTAVNLGEEESESRIIVQRNIQEMEISLTVYLTDGISATIQYPMCTEKDYAYCETAYLQYDNKESIVLEIVNGTSNYGAAEYHVLHVEKDSQGFEIVEDATILGEQPLTGDRYVYSLVGFVGNVSMISAEDLITTVYGKPAVRFVDWDSGKKEGETYYLYYDQEWKVEKDSSAAESEDQTEEPPSVNPDELADVFGIPISLPENPNWIVNSEYHLIDDNNLEITYYDPGLDSDCVILVAKNEALALSENEYDERLNESWEGWTINGQHIVVKVQRGKNGSNTVLATWDYNEYQFAIIGEIEGELDSGPIAKVALFIIENLN